MKEFYLEQQHMHGTANKRMIEAIRSNPYMDGYCVHALTGGDWILGAGLLDLWRNPKSYAYEATKAANQPRIISVRTIPRNVYAQQGMELKITGINDLENIAANYEISIQSKEGKEVFNDQLKSNWQTGISSLFNQKINTKEWSGHYTVKVKVRDQKNQVLTENFIAFEVFNQEDLKAPAGKVAVLDFKPIAPRPRLTCASTCPIHDLLGGGCHRRRLGNGLRACRVDLKLPTGTPSLAGWMTPSTRRPGDTSTSSTISRVALGNLPSALWMRVGQR